MNEWRTNFIALAIFATLIAKWYEEKKIDLTDWTNIIGLLSTVGFISAKDA